jgi:spermidine synthase
MARSGGPKLRFLWGGIVALAILSSGLLLEKTTLIRPDSKLIHYQESRYGRIEVHQNREMRTLFIDGVPLFTNQNQTIAEEIIHYPLVQLNRPRHILIISGEGGIMQEVAKYNPETVDYVELDPEVTTAEIKYGLIDKIERLNIIHQDGRRFLTGTSKQYDAVIMNLPEPETYQLNRFYTDQFYNLVKKRLNPHGVLSFSMQGFDNYLPEPQRKKLALVYHTVKRYFKHVLLLPGQQTFYICSDNPLTTDIPKQLEKKDISTHYISGYYAGNLSAWRISNLNNLMEPATTPNLDFSPRLMRLMFSQWFTKYSTSPHLFTAILLLLSVGFLMIISKESFVLFTTGFVNMGSEILIIFAFQIIFGYIYFQIGTIVTIFLTGLLPGAWVSDRLQFQGRQWLLAADGALILLSGLFILGITIGGYRLPVVFFLAFGFLVSLVCGFQFPVALKMQGGSGSAVSQAFSADLMGAACGTMVTSLLLIPYLGIVWTALVLMGLKLSSITLWQKGFFRGRP